MSTYCFDIDGVICNNTWGKYGTAQPDQSMVDIVNKLFDEGHKIKLFTARGGTTGIDWRATTEEQMNKWGVKYHELIMGKPEADFFIDDKGVTLDEIRERIT